MRGQLLHKSLTEQVAGKLAAYYAHVAASPAVPVAAAAPAEWAPGVETELGQPVVTPELALGELLAAYLAPHRAEVAARLNPVDAAALSQVLAA